MKMPGKLNNLSRIFFPEIRIDLSPDCEIVKSNLPLQMAAYFNALFIPVWVIVLINFLLNNYNRFDQLIQTILITIICTSFFIEILRIYMVYEGNLKDRIPELAGFWMLSVFLQLPLQGVLLFNPYFELRALEVVTQSIIFVLLLFEIIFGYVALRFTASQQAKEFRLKRNKTKADNENKNK